MGIDVEQKEVIGHLAKYPFGEGIKSGVVVTNGAVWMLIGLSQEGTMLSKRVVWKADLESEDFPSIYEKITKISKSNVEQIEVIIKRVQILDEIWRSLLKDPSDMIKALIPVVKSTLAQGYPGYQFRDVEIADFLHKKH